MFTKVGRYPFRYSFKPLKLYRFYSMEKKENIYTIPNILTVSRIVASPYLGYLVTNGQYQYAFAGFLIAGVTDLVHSNELIYIRLTDT
jgi:hypothetical protein